MISILHGEGDEDVRGGESSVGFLHSVNKNVFTVAISVMILVTGLVVMAVMAVSGDEKIGTNSF